MAGGSLSLVDFCERIRMPNRKMDEVASIYRILIGHAQDQADRVAT
jgi:hypothetical protein